MTEKMLIEKYQREYPGMAEKLTNFMYNFIVETIDTEAIHELKDAMLKSEDNDELIGDMCEILDLGPFFVYHLTLGGFAAYEFIDNALKVQGEE